MVAGPYLETNGLLVARPTPTPGHPCVTLIIMLIVIMFTMTMIMIIMRVMILTIIIAFNHGDDVTYEVANPCVPRARVAHQSPCCQCVNLQIMGHRHPFHHHHDPHPCHPYLGEPCDQVLTVWIFPPEFVFRPSLRPGNSHLDFKKATLTFMLKIFPQSGISFTFICCFTTFERTEPASLSFILKEFTLLLKNLHYCQHNH